MKTALFILLLPLTLLGQEAFKTNSGYSTNVAWLTISNNHGPLFLTISNRPYVQFEGAYVIRVTDAEWKTITNHYAEKIKTETLKFYGK